MNSIQDTNNIEKAFYSDGYKLGMEVTDKEPNSKSLFLGINKMHLAIEQFIESLNEFAKQHGQLIDCKKGCEWCCHQPVFVLSYEIDYLNYFIRNNFNLQKQKEIQKRAQEKNNKLKNLINNVLLNSKHPCPLLDNGTCLTYEARPIACRIYLSTNIKTCLRFFNNPEDKNNYPALLDLPMRAGRMINEGFKAALKTNGIEVKEFRIEEKLQP